MIHRKTNLVNHDRPPTVDEFLTINPLPPQLRHLEPSLRRLPNAQILIQIMVGCLQYDLGSADFNRIIASVGELFSHERQRCAACFSWTSQYHAILIGRSEDYRAVPMCDPCTVRFEAGRQSKQMERNLNAYGEVAA